MVSTYRVVDKKKRQRMSIVEMKMLRWMRVAGVY